MRNLQEHAWNEHRFNLHIRRQGNYSASFCFVFFPSYIFLHLTERWDDFSYAAVCEIPWQALTDSNALLQRQPTLTAWAPPDRSLPSTPPDLLWTSSEPTTHWIKAGGAECQGIGRNGTVNPSCQAITKLISWYFLLIGLVCLFLSFFPLFFSPSSSGMRNYTICEQNVAFRHHPLFVCITFFGGKRLSTSAQTERSEAATVAAVKQPFSGPVFFTHPSFVVCALIVVVCVFSDSIVGQECQNGFRIKSKSLDKNGLTETIFPTPICIY